MQGIPEYFYLNMEHWPYWAAESSRLLCVRSTKLQTKFWIISPFGSICRIFNIKFPRYHGYITSNIIIELIQWRNIINIAKSYMLCSGLFGIWRFSAQRIYSGCKGIESGMFFTETSDYYGMKLYGRHTYFVHKFDTSVSHMLKGLLPSATACWYTRPPNSTYILSINYNISLNMYLESHFHL